MIAIVPKNLGQQAALAMGWSGAGQGAGGHASWVHSLTPQMRKEYDMAIGGNPAASPASTMPLLEEPLHQWETEGLTAQAGGADTSQMENILAELRTRFGGALDTASGYTKQGVASVTPEEITARQNPHASALKSRLSESAERIRAAATAGQGLRGARSFGDTATGVQMGAIDAEQMRGEGDIDYKTWTDALNQINTERNRMLTGASTEQQGAQTAASGGNTAFNLAKMVSDTGVLNAGNKTAAGRYVRDYNQGINDTIKNDILAEQGDPLQRLIQTMNLIKGFESNTSSGQTGGMTSPLTQVGGAAQAGGTALTKLYNGGLPSGATDLGGLMPWLG